MLKRLWFCVMMICMVFVPKNILAKKRKPKHETLKVVILQRCQVSYKANGTKQRENLYSMYQQRCKRRKNWVRFKASSLYKNLKRISNWYKKSYKSEIGLKCDYRFYVEKSKVQYSSMRGKFIWIRIKKNK